MKLGFAQDLDQKSIAISAACDDLEKKVLGGDTDDQTLAPLLHSVEEAIKAYTQAVKSIKPSIATCLYLVRTLAL